MSRHRQVKHRPSLRYGLPYRWWLTEGFWAGLSGLLILPVLTVILVAWFFDLKAWW